MGIIQNKKMTNEIDISEYNLCTDQIDMKEILENFVCKVCKNVAIDPRKCSLCSTVQCNDCSFITNPETKVQTYKCHAECESKECIKLNRIEQNILNAITFDCHEKDCTTQFKYEEYSKHMKECHPKEEPKEESKEESKEEPIQAND